MLSLDKHDWTSFTNNLSTGVLLTDIVAFLSPHPTSIEG